MGNKVGGSKKDGRAQEICSLEPNYSKQTLEAAFDGGRLETTYRRYDPGAATLELACPSCPAYLATTAKAPIYTASYTCGKSKPKRVTQTTQGIPVEFDCRREDTTCRSAQLRVYDGGRVQFLVSSRRGYPAHITYPPFPRYKTGMRTAAHASARGEYQGRGRYVRSRSGGYTVFSEKDTPMGIGQFIGSPSGDFYLVLRDNGKGVVALVPARRISACREQNPRIAGKASMTSRAGGVVAPFKMSEGVATTRNKGRLAYVDTYDKLRWHAQPGVTKNSKTYQKLGNYAMSGRTRPLAQYRRSSQGRCRRKCNELDDCHGYVYQGRTCKLYGQNMFPGDLNRLGPNRDASMFVMLQKPKISNEDCSQRVVGVSQTRIAGLEEGSPIVDGSKCRLADITQEAAGRVERAEKRYEQGTADLADKAVEAAAYNSRLESAAKEQVQRQEAAAGQMTDAARAARVLQGHHETSLGMEVDSRLDMLSRNYNMLMWTTAGIGVTAACLHFTR